jgi:thymidylate kinase
MEWKKQQKDTLVQFVSKLNKENIKYFILRSYQGLPDCNSAKDVDIMIEPGKLKLSENLLMDCFRNNLFTHLHSDSFDHVHCYNAMDMVKKTAIHIDLIEGYIFKGYEIFPFDELYAQTMEYKGLIVLNPFFDGVMILIYKLFGYRKPKLKESYKESIKASFNLDTLRFSELLKKLLGESLATKVTEAIRKDDFDSVISYASEMTRELRKYVRSNRPFSIIGHSFYFLNQKFNRIVINYKKYERSIALMAPDGAGKTTFLDSIIDKMNYMYINNPEDNRFHVYHFRPNILPNIGEVGEKMKIKEQDKDFTNPHRGKPANPLSSLLRITYYWADYVIGWQKCVRNDVHYDRYTIFDRYCFDFIVDPRRTKLNLPMWIRKVYVATIPKPKIVFFLNADADTIFARKQELSYEEIKRQLVEYRNLVKKNKRFITLDATKTPNELSEEALNLLINKYTREL